MFTIIVPDDGISCLLDIPWGYVSKSKDMTLLDRNHRIRAMRDEGRTMQVIADTVGLSKARVNQILAELDDEVTTDGYRSFLRSQLEVGLAKAIEIIREPPPKKVSAGGKVMYEPDTDDPSGRTPDYSRPLYDKQIQIDAVKALPSLTDRLSKLYGVDARQPKVAEDDDQRVQWVTFVNKVVADRQRLQDRLAVHGEYLELDSDEDSEVVEAEVVSPGEPGS